MMGLGTAWISRLIALAWLVLLGLGVLVLGSAGLIIALIVAGAVGLAGIVGGFTAGIRNFLRVLEQARTDARRVELDAAPLPRWFNRHPQPAFLLPAYGRVWHISGYLWRNVWGGTQHDAQAWFRRAAARRTQARRRPKHSWLDYVPAAVDYALSGGQWLGGLFYYVAAFVIVSAAILLLWLMAVLTIVSTTLLVLLLGLFNRLYAIIYRITLRCPNCHADMPIPIYVCDKCGTFHDRLWPSVYGVRAHECKGLMPDGSVCHNKLPTLDWWGRRKLDRICPHCNYALYHGIGRETNIHIPIVGGPAAGKSTFMVAALSELISTHGPQHNLEVRLTSAESEASLTRAMGILRSGRPIEKTSDAEDNLPAYTVDIKGKSDRVSSLLYLYDAAGEYYTREERTLRQAYFNYVQGVIFIIDPFSIDMVQAEYREQLAAAPRTLAPSTENLESVYERMLRVMEANQGPHPGRQFPQPVAVVLTKADAFDLEQHIGLPAAHALMQRNPRLRFPEDAINVLVEQYLVRKGAYNFVSSLHGQFSTVKFFSTSALAYDQAQRTLQPLLWIMGEAGALPVRRDRARLVDRADREQSRQPRRGLSYYVWDSLAPAAINPTDQRRSP